MLLLTSGCASKKADPLPDSLALSADKPSDSADKPGDSAEKSSDSSTGKTMKIRPSALAGRWYSANPQELRASIEGYLRDAKQEAVPGVRAIVVPHAGHYWSGPTAAEAYRALGKTTYRRVFIFCPNHRVPVRGAVSVSADAFETPLGNIPVDRRTVDAWQAGGLIRIDDGAHKLEHAIEIQLPFLQVIFADHMPAIVPIIAGELSTSEVQAIAAKLREEMGPDDLLLISSDFLHYGENYGYVPFGAPVQENIRKYDARTIEAIQKLDGSSFEKFARETPHAACGINSLRILAFTFTFEHSHYQARELAYDTSGRRSGEDDMSVSYVAMAITDTNSGENMNDGNMNADKSKTPVSPAAQKTAHDIVRRALRAAVDAQRTSPLPADIDLGSDSDVFRESYGVFVTLNEPNGNLRGCIGNILPVATLAESLWGRAQDAALNDPRFDPVQPGELPGLSIEISVLTKPEPIPGPDHIVIGKHGVVMRKLGRSAVFLPQVAPEQGWNVEQMLTALSRKAGLAPQAWREGAEFSVFEAQVF